jgi:hypothetical protein
MHNLMLTLIALVVSQVAYATVWTDDQKKCGQGVYCADQMVCIGQIVDQKPKGVLNEYTRKILYIQTFKTVKKNDPNELVDSLQMAAEYIGDKPDIDMDEAWKRADFRFGDYGPPARVNEQGEVHTSWASGYSKGLELQILSSEARQGYRFDKLKGYEKIRGDVVSDYNWTYECEAKVVDTPTRIVDRTTTP